MDDFIKTFIKPIHTSKEVFIYLFFAFSPLGIILPYLLIYALGICVGALGSGVSCYVPAFEFYPATVALYWEVSFMLFVIPGVTWFLVAIVIWLKLLFYVLRYSMTVRAVSLLIILTSTASLFILYENFQTKIPYQLALNNKDTSYCTLYLEGEEKISQCILAVNQSDTNNDIDCRNIMGATDSEMASCIERNAKQLNSIKECENYRLWGIDAPESEERCFSMFVGTAQWLHACRELADDQYERSRFMCD